MLSVWTLLLLFLPLPIAFFIDLLCAFFDYYLHVLLASFSLNLVFLHGNLYMKRFSFAFHFYPMLIVLTCNLQYIHRYYVSSHFILFSLLLCLISSSFRILLRFSQQFYCFRVFFILFYFSTFNKSTFIHFFRIVSYLQWLWPRTVLSLFSFNDTYLTFHHAIQNLVSVSSNVVVLEFQSNESV